MFKIKNSKGITIATENKLCDAEKKKNFLEGVLSEKVTIEDAK